jgi:hypothetical protein
MVGVSVIVGVRVIVGVSVGVDVSVDVGVTVAVCVLVGVFVLVGDRDGVNVCVGVVTGVGVGLRDHARPLPKPTANNINPKGRKSSQRFIVLILNWDRNLRNGSRVWMVRLQGI